MIDYVIPGNFQSDRFMPYTQQSGHFFLALLANGPDLISVLDPAGNYHFVSGSVTNLLGYAPEKIIGTNAFSYIHEEDLPLITAAWAKALNDTVTVLPCFRFKNKQGAWRWFECTLTNKLQHPEIQGYITNARDVTDRIEAEQRKKKNQSRYEALFYNHPDAVFELNPAGFFCRINRHVSEITGYPDEQVLQAHFQKFVHADDLARAMEAFRNTLTGKSQYMELSIVRQNGSVAYIGITCVAVVVEQQVESIQCIAKDITLLKNYDNYIKDQAIQLNSIMERIPESFYALDSNWCFTYVNTFVTTYLNKEKEDLLGKNVWELYPNLLQSNFYQVCMQVAQSGCPAVFEEHYPYWNNSTISFQIFPAGKGLSVHFVDVTEKKREQDRLEKLSLVASKTTTAVMILDHQYRIEWVNEAFENVTGYQLGECYLKNPAEFLAGEETQEKVLKKIRHKTKQAKAFTGELLNYTKTGKKIWFYIEITPVFTEEDQVDKFVCIRTDITEKKIREEELLMLTRDLFKQNRDLQQFSYIVSHNLRSPAANIMGLTDILNQLDKDNNAFEETISKITASSQALDHVIRDMNQILTIRENGYVLDKDEFNVAQVYWEALSRIQYKLNHCPHTISTTIDNSISMCSNRSYLFEILKNLLSNAIKFRKKGEVLKLELKAERKKNTLELVVKDNGIGMDMKLVKKDLFRLYRKFHPGYDGRGVGLFLVKTYVDALDGNISVASEPNRGTVFSIKFNCPARKSK